MAFITAGMGGGTGTGGAPILAKICKDLGILTVGIVTTPFAYEGKKRIAQAEEGIMLLKSHVDTLLVISNDKLRHQFGNLKMKEAFGKADNVLATAAKCITDVINSTGQINVDFADVCTVMKNGGVAILGSAIADGENRAHMAIENALTSPLLNDNDIRGAKWILININSAEGEHEFTMDEVEIIQNYLLGQAGEDTDVILGLGYDNTLGNAIGITLIATGFEHKDPFDRAEKTQANPEDQKIVLKLEMPQPAVPVKVQQPAFEFEEKRFQPIESVTEVKEPEITAAVEEPVADPFMPVLKEETEIVEILRENTVEKTEESPVFFEISSSPEKAAEVSFTFEEFPTTVQKPSPLPIAEDKQSTPDKEASNSPLSSGGFLLKPTQIYAEEQTGNPKSNSNEEPLPLQIKLQDDEPVLEMRLVVKESQKAAEELPLEQTQPIMMSNVEEPAMQDEAEELRRRATERIAKLRNLSFNINAADPNNEFESVPAYLRRNMEMHNQLADVESFYSNYVVKSDENNQANISTLNTFLDGNKPD